MAEIGVSDTEGRLQEVIDTAQTEAAVLQRNGRPVAVVISSDRYQELMDALDAHDALEAARRRRGV